MPYKKTKLWVIIPFASLKCGVCDEFSKCKKIHEWF
jgi:hypothetical protein